MEILLCLIFGIFIGVFGGILFFKVSYKLKSSELRTKIQILENENNSLKFKVKSDAEKYKEDLKRTEETFKEQIQSIKQEKINERELLEKKFEKHLQESKSEWEQKNQILRQEQQKRFDEILDKVTVQLKNTTGEMLKQREQEFSESSQQSLKQILNPLKETMEKMKSTMTDSTLKNVEMGSALKTELENAKRLSEAARKSAEELSNVFRHRGKVQGDWGETILKELLDSQGLKNKVHYDIQTTLCDSMGNTIKNETGKRLKPDVLLHLDKKREIVIDSKVSLSAFMDFINAESEETKKIALAQHLESLKRHIKELSQKDYSNYIQPPKVKMDYVIMFVPHSGALWCALNAEPDLWRKAMEKNVFITDEQTLYAALRIIDLTWTQIAQAENHERVFFLANEMIDRVGLFFKNFQSIGKALETAKGAFEDCEKKLSSKGHSIQNTCNKLLKLGAKQSEKNPLPMTQEIERTDEILESEN